MALDSCRSFSLLDAIAKSIPLLFAFSLRERERAISIDIEIVAIVERVMTIREQYRKKSTNQKNQYIQKYKANRFIVKTVDVAWLKKW